MSALSLSLRDKERFRDWEIERAWQHFEAAYIKEIENNVSEEGELKVKAQRENENLLKEIDELKIENKTTTRENQELRVDLKGQVELNISTKELIGKMNEIIKTQEVELQNLRKMKRTRKGVKQNKVLSEKIYDILDKNDIEEKSECGIDLFERTFPMISDSLNQISEVFQKSDQMNTNSSSEQTSMSFSALEPKDGEATLKPRKPTPRNVANGKKILKVLQIS